MCVHTLSFSPQRTSEWTLDYPPFFAYFEWLLSQVAHYVDPAFLQINNLNYEHWRVVFFQRATVLGSEMMLVYALHKCDCSVGGVCRN